MQEIGGNNNMQQPTEYNEMPEAELKETKISVNRKRLALIVSAIILVIGIIALVIFFAITNQADDQDTLFDDTDTGIVVTKVYDVDPESPYLTICFNEAPIESTVLVDTSGVFNLKALTFIDSCVDFIINSGRGVGSLGQYDIYISAVADNGTSIDREKLTVNVVAALDPASDANQTSAVLRNSTVYINDLRQSDPIYEYLYNPFNTQWFSIALQVDDDSNLILTILIRVPTPSNPSETAVADVYKRQALDQIRAWGFNPDDYNLRVIYFD